MKAKQEPEKIPRCWGVWEPGQQGTGVGEGRAAVSSSRLFGMPRASAKLCPPAAALSGKGETSIKK